MRTCPRCGRDSPVDFQFCPSCGSGFRPERTELQERKLVTILFADVTGSTALGEQLDPERLGSILSTYFSAMRAVIEGWGGTVEKFIGDAVMAVFGSPMVHEDDPVRALQAAREMQQRLVDLNAGFRAQHGVELQIRIGVNTGEVLAPLGGMNDQMLVTGDAVNVAARLEQAAEPGTVLAGDRTYLAARGSFGFGEPRRLAVKGKSGSTVAHPVLEPLSDARRGVPGLSAGMVGRTRELETVLGLLDEAVESQQPRMVSVFGPAGIGKSRLLRELVANASVRHADATVLRGRCLPVGRGITYWALGEILRAASGVGFDEPGQVAADKLRGHVHQALARMELRDEEVEQTVYALATTAGIPIPGNPLDTADPGSVSDVLARAWPRFATGLATRGATVFVIEDLHWAEERLLEMLQHLLARSAGPILLVASARPEFAEAHPSFVAGRDDISSVALRPLTAEQSRELIDQLLRVVQLPERLRDEIIGRADGNPFFLEEIIRRLIDEGALVREGDAWRATGAASQIVLPDTIQGLLAARIDALPPMEKRTLQEAAVLGRTFWAEPVTQAVDGRGADVSGTLMALEQKGLIFVRPTSAIADQVEFMFKHALVRDVAYAGLPTVRRARAHAQHAEWIERIVGDRQEELIELVAHHYALAVTGENADLAWAERAEEGETVRRRAVETLLAAGRAVRQRSATDRALELHQQALALAVGEAERMAALEQLADDHAVAFHGDEALEAYEAALELVRAHGLGAEHLVRLAAKATRMAAEKSGAFRVMRQPDPVERLVNEALAHAGEDEWAATLLVVFGSLWLYRASLTASQPVSVDERIAKAREGRELARSVRRPDLELFAIRSLSELYMVRGEFRLSLETSLEQESLLPQITSVPERALALFEMAAAILDLGSDPERALELGRQSQELARDLSPHERMHASFILVSALYHLGRWDELVPIVEEHLGQFAAEPGIRCFAVRGAPIFGALALAHRGDPRADAIARQDPIEPDRNRPFFQGLHARLQVARGSPADGRALVGALVEHQEPGGSLQVVLGMIEALTELRAWDELRAFLPRAHELVGGTPLGDAVIVRAEGQVRAAAGERADAQRLLRDAMHRFSAPDLPFERARTAEALAAVVEGPEHERLLDDALAAYRRIGAPPHEERVSRKVAEVSTPASASARPPRGGSPGRRR